MKIIQLQAENVKKLKAVSITPEGNVIQITGPNGSGKTSVLDCIWYALAGTKEIPSQVVRRGSEQAVVRLDLGEVIILRQFTEHGGTNLRVEASNGAKFSSPQKMLDSLLGELAFDPLAFTRMQPRAQLETLRGIVNLKVDIDQLDTKISIAYDKRTEVNRRVTQLKSQIDAIRLPANLPESADVSALLRKLESAANKNTEITTQAANLKKKQDRLNELRKQAREIADEISQCERALERVPELPELFDIGALRKQIEAARANNEVLAQVDNREKLKRELKCAESESDKLTRSIEASTDEKNDAISSAKMPVKGLSFGAGEVLFNKLPFTQASSAEQLRVSVAIAMAANPKLRIIRIQDGSLLDKDSMKILSEMAEDKDFQVWIERVDISGKVGIVMEEGEIVS